MKKLILIILVVLVIAMLPLLGGSMIWMLGGADGLDINGSAQETDRPAGSISVGDGWGHYGGDAGGSRYSKLDQINPGNVAQLLLTWQYQTGDLENRPEAMRQSATEGTPLLVEDSLVFCTPFNEVIAVHPGTGEELWRFDPHINLQQDPANKQFSNITMALPVGDELWIGTFVGDRIAYRSLKE